MKRVIKRTFNKLGERCKTYIIDYNGSIIIIKLTLIPKPNEYRYDVGGEMLIKETDRYSVTFHRFGIKQSTLFDALSQLDLIPS
jgi:hypothetical protein